MGPVQSLAVQLWTLLLLIERPNPIFGCPKMPTSPAEVCGRIYEPILGTLQS
jgi:hypothetical protein